MMELSVFKFGGTSMGSAGSIRRVARLVQNAASHHSLVVVVSAMNGITDQIAVALQWARTSESDKSNLVIADIRHRHHSVIAELFPSEAVPATIRLIEPALAELRALVSSANDSDKPPLELADAALSIGEEMSAALLSAFLRSIGVDCEFCDSARFVTTNERFGDALPDMHATRRNCATILNPLLSVGCTPVVTGYRGATENGKRTTLGRGGSDYSATIIAAALNAAEVVIWTDVNGVLSADPRICPKTSLFPALTYSEAIELSRFGAKVIHHKAIQPARDANIPVHIKNSFHPEAAGTSISSRVPPHASVAAATSVADASVIKIATNGGSALANLEPALVRRAHAENLEVLLSFTDDSSRCLSLVVRKEDAPFVLELVLAEFGELLREREPSVHDVVVVTAIHPARVAREFRAFLRHSALPVKKTIHHASGTRSSFLLHEREREGVLRKVHDFLHSELQRTRVPLAPRNLTRPLHQSIVK